MYPQPHTHDTSSQGNKDARRLPTRDNRRTNASRHMHRNEISYIQDKTIKNPTSRSELMYRHATSTPRRTHNPQFDDIVEDLFFH